MYIVLTILKNKIEKKSLQITKHWRIKYFIKHSIIIYLNLTHTKTAKIKV